MLLHWLSDWLVYWILLVDTLFIDMMPSNIIDIGLNIDIDGLVDNIVIIGLFFNWLASDGILIGLFYYLISLLILTLTLILLMNIGWLIFLLETDIISFIGFFIDGWLARLMNIEYCLLIEYWSLIGWWPLLMLIFSLIDYWCHFIGYDTDNSWHWIRWYLLALNSWLMMLLRLADDWIFQFQYW